MANIIRQCSEIGRKIQIGLEMPRCPLDAGFFFRPCHLISGVEISSSNNERHTHIMPEGVLFNSVASS